MRLKAGTGSTATATRMATNLRRGTRTTGTVMSMPTRPLRRIATATATARTRMTMGTIMAMGIRME